LSCSLARETSAAPLLVHSTGEGKQNSHITRALVKTQKEEDFREESIEMNLSDRQKSGFDISFRFFFGCRFSSFIFIFLHQHIILFKNI
jgi:hypothetical protein